MENPKILTGLIDKTIGVAFKEKIEPVYFKTRWGIHTFFVKHPIDVFVMDDNFVVRKMIRGLKPWRVFFWNPRYKNVLELPQYLKKYKKYKIGDKIML
jgi:uncharacterized membrane protein (UPF0127 family)